MFVFQLWGLENPTPTRMPTQRLLSLGPLPALGGALDTVSSHCGGRKGKTKGLLLLRPRHSHNPMQEGHHDLLPFVATILKMKFQWEFWREFKWSCCCHHLLLHRAAPCCTDPSAGDKSCPLTRLKKKRFQITPD